MATLTTITTGMEKGPEAIDANFTALNNVPDVLYGKVEDHGSGLNGYVVTGYFLRIPIDPVARMAIMYYVISINNAANNLAIPSYQAANVFKFDSSVMANDNNEFGGGAATFSNFSVNGWGTMHFQSYLNSDGTIALHNGQNIAAKDGGANCTGIKLIKY